MTFVQRAGKLNFKALEEIDSSPMINFSYHPKFPKLAALLKRWLVPRRTANEFGICSKQPGIVAGKPNSVLRQCK